jgi:predicted RNA-binding Zn-ribbon protein involved in translation (DUF1610 family)
MDPRKRANRQMDVANYSPKTIWKDKRREAWSFFCPNCKAQRKLPYHPRPGRRRHFIQVGLTALAFTCATWSWFHWRGLVSFLPFWAFFEIFFRSRVRVALSCPHCGFDPYLYLTDVKRARAEIEKHWRGKFAEKGVPYPEPNRPEPAEVPEKRNLTEMRTGR